MQGSLPGCWIKFARPNCHCLTRLSLLLNQLLICTFNISPFRFPHDFGCRQIPLGTADLVFGGYQDMTYALPTSLSLITINLTCAMNFDGGSY